MFLRQLRDWEIKVEKSDHSKEQSLSLNPSCHHRLKEIWLWTHPSVLFPLFMFASQWKKLVVLRLAGKRSTENEAFLQAFFFFFLAIPSFSPLAFSMHFLVLKIFSFWSLLTKAVNGIYDKCNLQQTRAASLFYTCQIYCFFLGHLQPLVVSTIVSKWTRFHAKKQPIVLLTRGGF